MEISHGWLLQPLNGSFRDDMKVCASWGLWTHLVGICTASTRHFTILPYSGHQWLILMREVEHPSQIGHVSVHHLKPTLPEVEEDLIALICVTTVPHFSSVFNLLCPWTWCDTGWPQWNCIQSDKFKRRIPLCIQPFVMLNWKWTPQENWVVMVKCAACKIWP